MLIIEKTTEKRTKETKANSGRTAKKSLVSPGLRLRWSSPTQKTPKKIIYHVSLSDFAGLTSNPNPQNFDLLTPRLCLPYKPFPSDAIKALKKEVDALSPGARDKFLSDIKVEPFLESRKSLKLNAYDNKVALKSIEGGSSAEVESFCTTAHKEVANHQNFQFVFEEILAQT